jgi:hypothetical protein
MISEAKNILKYWLRTIEAIAAETAVDGDKAVIIGQLPPTTADILAMGEEGGAARPATIIEGVKDTSWRMATIQVQAAVTTGDRHMQPVPVLAVPCEVMVQRGRVRFRPPANSLIPSIPRTVLQSAGEDKEGIIIGSVEAADEWLHLNASAIETLRSSGSWTGWWKCAVSLLATVSGQTVEDPIGQLANELTANLVGGPDGRCDVVINVVDTAAVPGAYINISSTMKALIELDYLREDSLPTRLLSGQAGNKNFKLPKLIAEAALNVGTMDKFEVAGGRQFYALDSSQRVAVLRHFSGELLSAVAGPPGTGKTATMRAIIGDAIVRPLLSNEANPRPKMILATGATNQAVTNIISNFAGASSPADPAGTRPIDARWLDGAASFGWFAPSRTIQSKMRTDANSAVVGYQFDQFLGFGRRCEDPDGKRGVSFTTTYLGAASSLSALYKGHGIASRLAEAATTYLQAAGAAIGTRSATIERLSDAPELLNEVVSQLRARVVDQAKHQFEVQQALWQMLATGDRGAVAGALGLALTNALTKCGHTAVSPEVAQERAAIIITQACQVDFAAPRAEQAALDLFHQVQAAIDEGPRIATFQLAARYWEGRFLLSRLHRFQNSVEWRQTLSATATEQGLAAAIRLDMDEQLSLAPCIVATAHSLPTIFGVQGRPEAAFGIADEMIVDEAGQAQQELIGPVTAFAKRAIFLGDIEQIEPVRAVTPERDAVLARSFTMAERLPEDAVPDVCKVSAGSAMHLAMASSDFAPMTLKFHYRCRPAIISWSNQRCYDNGLIAVRPDYEPKDQDELIPTLGYIRVSGKPDRGVRGSIGNPTEAAAVADFLVNHRVEIETRFRAPLHDCVAVITPYARQNTIIKGILRQRFKDQPDVLLHKMIIGSVHQLQGAERPLVMFSVAVNKGLADNVPFFERSNNLLNVARSRAAESFILVAAPSMIDRVDDTPFGSFAADIKANGVKLSVQPQGLDHGRRPSTGLLSP